MADEPRDLMAALRESLDAAKVERRPAPASQEGDGQPEGARARLARVAEYVRQNPSYLSVHVLAVSYGDLPRHEAVAAFASDLDLAAASQGEGGLADIETLRAGVQALIRERTDRQHPPGSVYFERQRAELNALDAVVRLIDTGDWHTPPRPLPGPGGGLDRKALESLVRRTCQIADSAWGDGFGRREDCYVREFVAALAPLLTGGGRDGG